MAPRRICTATWAAAVSALATPLWSAELRAQPAARTAPTEAANAAPPAPSAAELATIRGAVWEREAARLRRLRVRWRVFVDAGLGVLTNVRLANEGLEASYGAQPRAAVWVGVRRGLSLAVDVQVRVGFQGPYGLSYRGDGSACPSGSAAGYALAAPSSSTGGSVLAEAAFRASPPA